MCNGSTISGSGGGSIFSSRGRLRNTGWYNNSHGDRVVSIGAVTRDM